jgi:hypothetical protein
MSYFQLVSAFLGGPQITSLVTGFLGVFQFRYLAITQRLRGVIYKKGFKLWLLGDIPSWAAHVWEKEEIYTWMARQHVELDSLIIQVSVRPLSKSFIILSDYREMQDILRRRRKTFDRAEFMQRVFKTVISQGMIAFTSDNPKFHVNKQLVRGFMAPMILNEARNQNSLSR